MRRRWLTRCWPRGRMLPGWLPLVAHFWRERQRSVPGDWRRVRAVRRAASAAAWRVPPKAPADVRERPARWRDMRLARFWSSAENCYADRSRAAVVPADLFARARRRRPPFDWGAFREPWQARSDSCLAYRSGL